MAEATYRTAAVILAAGEGSRMNMKSTKQRLLICGKSVLRRTLEAFDKASSISSLTVVCKDTEREFALSECENLSKPVAVVIGGKCRAESAKNGFAAIPADSEYVAIHDCARCLISPHDIDTVISAAYKYSAATASYAVSDTLKKCDAGGLIEKTVSRESLRCVQTPQAFSVSLYRKALEKSEKLDSSITDDNMLIELLGEKVFCTDTSKNNIKITTSSDLELAEFLISKESGV